MLLNKLSVTTALIITTPLVIGQNVLSPPAQVPDDASAVVKPSFPSFGIQGSSFPAFTGDAKNVNVFSRNLIEGLQNRTGGPLVIRIGGTNTYSDFAESNPNQAQDITPPQNGAGIGQRFVFGPSFFEGLQNWPKTKIIFDIPFAHKNRTNALFFAQNALKYIGPTRLEALEIGNEPDFYVRQKARPDGWGPEAYVQEWNDWAYWLSQQLNLPGKSFQGLTLAAFHPPGVWSAKTVIDKGITSQGHIKSISLHHYQTTDIGNIQASLMSHNAMRASVDKYQPDIEYMKSKTPKVEIVFGESGRYGPGTDSVDNAQGVFGSALWTADYLLYLMTQNVSRVHMQLSKVFGYVAWHPVQYGDITPGVRAPYFGHLLVAEFIGGSSTLRAKQISNDDRLPVYAAYDNGKLKRIAIINYNVWNGQGVRPSQKFNISVPEGTKTVLVKLMTSPGGASATGYFYWAGQAFSYANQGVGTTQPSMPQPQTIAAVNGKVSVDVGDSQAVLVELL